MSDRLNPARFEQTREISKSTEEEEEESSNAIFLDARSTLAFECVVCVVSYFCWLAGLIDFGSKSRFDSIGFDLIAARESHRRQQSGSFLFFFLSFLAVSRRVFEPLTSPHSPPLTSSAVLFTFGTQR